MLTAFIEKVFPDWFSFREGLFVLPTTCLRYYRFLLRFEQNLSFSNKFTISRRWWVLRKSNFEFQFSFCRNSSLRIVLPPSPSAIPLSFFAFSFNSDVYIWMNFYIFYAFGISFSPHPSPAILWTLYWFVSNSTSTTDTAEIRYQAFSFSLKNSPPPPHVAGTIHSILSPLLL